MTQDERDKLCMAILTMFVDGQYMDGLDTLCELVGWGKFMPVFYTRDEMDQMFNAKISKIKDLQTLSRKEPPRAKCPACKRPVNLNIEFKRRVLGDRCEHCGRAFHAKKSSHYRLNLPA